MKNTIAIVLVSGLLFSQPASAEGWLDSLKSLLGLGSSEAEQVAQQPSVQGLLSALTSNLDVSQQQAEGGLASILQYAKQNANPETFSALSTQVPGLESILSKVPDISNLEQGGLSGLLDKAAEYSESLKAVNDVKKQFEALGMTPDMIVDFVKQASNYLDTTEGQEAKKLLSDALSGLNI